MLMWLYRNLQRDQVLLVQNGHFYKQKPCLISLLYVLEETLYEWVPAHACVLSPPEDSGPLRSKCHQIRNVPVNTLLFM
jgi:hypothetical protein